MFDFLVIVAWARKIVHVKHNYEYPVSATLEWEGLPEPSLINLSTTYDVHSRIFQLLCRTETVARENLNHHWSTCRRHRMSTRGSSSCYAGQRRVAWKIHRHPSKLELIDWWIECGTGFCYTTDQYLFNYSTSDMPPWLQYQVPLWNHCSD